MKKIKLKVISTVLILCLLLFTACVKATNTEENNTPTYEQAYAQAVSLGYNGSLEDFISILKGETGDSAYQIAVDNGFEGTEEEWLNTLKGKSAYEIAVDNGFEGTQAEWLNTLKGEQGIQGEQGLTGQEGSSGLSAYQIAILNGFEGTEAEWLGTLGGQQGVAGQDGLSAYDIAISNGFEGTQTEWVSSLLQDNNNDYISDIIYNNNLINSVVEIYAIYEDVEGAASGVIISEDGYILTNAHCVVYEYGDGIPDVFFESISVKFRDDDTEYQVDIIDYDTDKDLAIIKFVETLSNLNPVVLGDSDSIDIGNTDIVIGNAAGLGITAASGIISETAANYNISDSEEGVIIEAIRTDAAINPGNSGGGLFNKDGQLIGIITFKIVSELYENLGFALSVNFAKDYIDSVMTLNYTLA